MSNGLSWSMTLAQYREYLIQHEDYQRFLAKLYQELKRKYTIKDGYMVQWAPGKSKVMPACKLNLQTLHFVMALLLKGTSADEDGRRGPAQTAYLKISDIKGEGASGWPASAASFLNSDGKRGFGDGNARIKTLADDMSLLDAANWFAAGMKTQNELKITNDQKVAVLVMINMLLRQQTAAEVQSEVNGVEANKKTVKDEIIDLIVKGGCRQIIFTGAPGTGKTYTAKEEIAKKLGTPFEGEKAAYALVQFHPSVDYTDFVEGLRPVMRGNQILFAKVDGTFKAFCRRVVTEGDPEKLYFFIIDEINRANLSKVFGELMYGLEKDKRGKENAFKTQYQNLPTYDMEKENKSGEKGDYLTKEEDVFADGFYIPENVVLLGTMNDIDRSVDSMDFALRRRFEWKEFVVKKEMLMTAFQAKDGAAYGKTICEHAGTLADSILALNEHIQTAGKVYGLNRQYDISHGQFANLPAMDTLDGVKQYVWEYRVESLLREYLRGEDEDAVKNLIEGAREAFGAPRE